MIRGTVIAIAISLSMSAYAVDGYKNLKFGMSKDEVKKANLCSFKESPTDSSDAWGCTDFKFANKKTMAFAYFIDNKFKRFGIVTDMDSAVGIAKGLQEKYGEASSSSTQEEFAAVDTTKGASAYLRFDNDTVYIQMVNSETTGIGVYLIYSSPDYDSLRQRKQAKMINDDL